MTQSLIAAALVVAALACSVWLLMPAAWRRAGAAWLARRATRSGLAQERARVLQASLERAGACGECAGCRGCAGGPPASR